MEEAEEKKDKEAPMSVQFLKPDPMKSMLIFFKSFREQGNAKTFAEAIAKLKNVQTTVEGAKYSSSGVITEVQGPSTQNGSISYFVFIGFNSNTYSFLTKRSFLLQQGKTWIFEEDKPSFIPFMRENLDKLDNNYKNTQRLVVDLQAPRFAVDTNYVKKFSLFQEYSKGFNDDQKQAVSQVRLI